MPNDLFILGLTGQGGQCLLLEQILKSNFLENIFAVISCRSTRPCTSDSIVVESANQLSFGYLYLGIYTQCTPLSRYSSHVQIVCSLVAYIDTKPRWTIKENKRAYLVYTEQFQIPNRKYSYKSSSYSDKEHSMTMTE